MASTSRTLASTNSRQSDPWYRYALSYTHASNPTGYRLITDTLSRREATQPQGYRFTTDTLSRRHAAQPQGYRFITDTLGATAPRLSPRSHPTEPASTGATPESAPPAHSARRSS